MKRIYPLPEVFNGDRWIIRSGRGECNTVDRVLKVPLSADDADRFTRNHEMAHCKITPRVPASKQCKKFGVSMMALQVCEDMRVHTFLAKAGIMMTGSLSLHDCECLVRRQLWDTRALAASLIAAWNTDDSHRLLNVLSTLMPSTILDELVGRVRLIHTRLLSGKGIHRWIGLRNCTIPAARLFDTLFPEHSDRVEQYGNIPITSSGATAEGKWGKLSIRHLQKRLSRQVLRVAHRKIYRDEGSRLAAPYRLPVDGRIFVQKKRSVGGTILIDGSGSMNLSTSELRKIIIAAPQATIAIYSGRKTSGMLSIIGENGRVVDDHGLQEARSSGSGNIVDGPSLRWLSTQDAPRVWVSDGLVTGTNDTLSVDLAAEAQRICMAHKIRRVEKAAAVVDLLKTLNLRGHQHGHS